MSEDGEGAVEDLPGYIPTGEDHRFQEVYGDLLHSKNGVHLSGGIDNDTLWQKRWRALEVMPALHYDAPIGRVGSRFVRALAAELTGVRQRR